MTCSFEQLSDYGVSEKEMRENAPVNFHHKTLEAARAEGYLQTKRVVSLPGTALQFSYYDPSEVEDFYNALADGWKPTPKPKLQLQFKNLTQEQFDALSNFAASEGIVVYVPRPRKRLSPALNGEYPDVVQEDMEFVEE